MLTRGRVLGAVLGALAILAALALARVTPSGGGKDYVVSSSAGAGAPPRPPAYTVVASPVASDYRGAWTSGAALYAVGTHGTIVRMDDPRAGFTPEASGTSVDLFAIAGGKRAAEPVVVVGARGTVLYRDDAGGWRRRASGFDDDLRAVHVDADGVLVAGAAGRIARATEDGWQALRTGTSAELLAIRRDGAGYVAVGRGGTIVHCATPNAAWMVVPSGTTRDLFAVAVVDGAAYAAGDDGTLLRRDASGAWTPDASGVHAHLRALAPGAGTLFALGESGAVLRLVAGRWTRDEPIPLGGVHALVLRLDSLWAFGDRGAIATLRLF